MNFKNFIFTSIPYYLIILIPILLISGPFLSDLSVSIISIIFLIEIIKYKKYKYINNIYFKIFLIFYIYLNLNSFLNENFFGLKNSVGYIRFGLFALAVWSIVEKRKDIINKSLFVIISCFAVLVLDGYLQYFSGKNFLGYSTNSPRVSSLFFDEFILGSYLTRIYPILFAFIVLQFRDKKNLLMSVAVLFILVETLIFISGDRTAFFLSTLSAVYLVIFISNFKFYRLVVLLFSFALIFLISIFNPVAKERFVDKTIDQMNLVKNDQKKYFFSKKHDEHYRSSIHMFVDNPVLGLGIKQFRLNCNLDKYRISEDTCSTHPHNTYVQLLAETGIIGFAFVFFLFCFLIFKSFVHLYSQFKGKKLFDNFEICLLSCLFINLWPFVPTGNFFNNWLSILYFYPLGFLLWSFNKKLN